MKKSNNQSHQNLYAVPERFLDEIAEAQEKILSILSQEREPKQTLGNFLSEKDAAELLGRKTTWFWNLRKQGILPFTKVGNKVFYSKPDILKMLEKNMKGGGHG